MSTARKNAVVTADAGDEDADWISVAAAARELRIGYATVLTKAGLGELETKKFGGRIWVSRASVDRAKGETQS